MKKIFTLILIGIIGLGKMSFAQHAVISHIDENNNKLGSALFDSYDETGCIETTVLVKAGNTMEHTNGGGQSGTNINSPFVTLTIQQIDWCNLVYVYYADVETWLGGNSSVAGNLTSASVDATLPAFDQVSGNTNNVHVVVNWTSTGGMLTHQFSNSHINGRGFHYSVISTGDYRLANATGSVTVDGGENLIPYAGIFNYIIHGGIDDNLNLSSPQRMAGVGQEANTNVNNELFFYPNPATDVLHLNLTNASSYSIVNMLGASVAQSNVEGEMYADVNLSSFAPGIYFLRLQTGDGQVVKKFVKE